MADPFKKVASDIDSPARNAEAVTPSDSADLPTVARGLYTGAGGNIAVYMEGDDSNTSVAFASAAAGITLPIRVRRVLSTGTTATGIVALW
jgi:hypothetical protein